MPNLVIIIIIGNLTMLKKAHPPHQHTLIPPKTHSCLSPYRQSTTHRTSCAIPSPAFRQVQENHDHLNTARCIGQYKKQSHGKSLREQINQKIEEDRTKKHAKDSHRRSQLLASLGKIVHESGTAIQYQLLAHLNRETEPFQREGRREDRAQQLKEFQQRQSQLVLLRKKKQQAGKLEQLKRQTIQCTFKPKLTPYRKL